MISAAAELFLGGSFHNVGIAVICDTAHVNKGTFYHFFPSKIHLLIEVMDRYVKQVEAAFSAIAASSDPPSVKVLKLYTVPEVKNRAWQEAFGTTSGCFIGNMTLELAGSEPIVREKVRWAMTVWVQAMQPIVEELKKAEGIDVDTASAANALLGVMQGAQVMAKATNEISVFPMYGAMALDMVRGSTTGSLAALNGDRLRKFDR